MLKVKIICVGKAKGDWVSGACDHYRKLLGRSCKLEILEIPESKASDGSTDSLKSAEGSAILARLGDKAISKRVWALEVSGDEFTSEAFATRIQSEMNSGVSELVFVIGGAYGLDSSVNKRADALISFSNFTLSHQVVRVALLEQLYRAFSIISGTSYHK
jgi:23S rRNA (pseudouridine1915-N3)-methyltransferase